MVCVGVAWIDVVWIGVDSNDVEAETGAARDIVVTGSIITERVDSTASEGKGGGEEMDWRRRLRSRTTQPKRVMIVAQRRAILLLDDRLNSDVLFS